MDGMIPLLIGGLVLFLYAISQLSEVMQDVFSENAKTIIAKYTRNIFLAIFIGIIITIVLGSSSAVIIITLVFINARTLTFKQALGIIMGANVGTTFSSQIIALDVGKYSVVLLFIGLVLELFHKKKSIHRIGQVLLYFGMLFFGLYIMEESVLPLKDSPTFEDWIARLDNPVEGALTGGLVTLIIQSSSATVGLAITLGKQSLINIPGGLAVMLGAELGTCSDTLLATINGTRQALKAGLFHLLFNLTSILLGLLLFFPFVHLVKWLSDGQGIDNHIANGHMLFNILGVVFFLPFVGLMEKMLNQLLPDKSRPS